jgi:hypothetical protein
MQIPEWLESLPDGLYGSVDDLMNTYQDGREEAAWKRLEASNALCEVKIRCWLNSDSYRERHPDE